MPKSLKTVKEGERSRSLAPRLICFVDIAPQEKVLNVP
ncbi:hypothetical protein P186_0469 [Pyrobaculum ferrireducens]|uniref:Uncharacterized protein n=1 Tax=Pyrobaculum ferrireducens TaxID=1104324 RepID=G7VGU0_9CREN|nr:hypothetical protein P186_0469 [Pyrobaculum ferrireducens]